MSVLHRSSSTGHVVMTSGLPRKTNVATRRTFGPIVICKIYCRRRDVWNVTLKQSYQHMKVNVVQVPMRVSDSKGCAYNGDLRRSTFQNWKLVIENLKNFGDIKI